LQREKCGSNERASLGKAAQGGKEGRKGSQARMKEGRKGSQARMQCRKERKEARQEGKKGSQARRQGSK